MAMRSANGQRFFCRAFCKLSLHSSRTMLHTTVVEYVRQFDCEGTKKMTAFSRECQPEVMG